SRINCQSIHPTESVRESRAPQRRPQYKKSPGRFAGPRLRFPREVVKTKSLRAPAWRINEPWHTCHETMSGGGPVHACGLMFSPPRLAYFGHKKPSLT